MVGALWTPRLNPQDIIAIEFETTLNGKLGTRGNIFSPGNDKPLREPITALYNGGNASHYMTIARRCSELWAATFLDGMRHYWVAQPIKAASLVALSVELSLNEALSGKVALERATMKQKGEDLFPTFFNTALNSKKARGEVANAWKMTLAGRNALLHRQESEFTWRPVDRPEPKIQSVQTIPGAAHFIIQAAKVVVEVLREAEAAASGGT